EAQQKPRWQREKGDTEEGRPGLSVSLQIKSLLVHRTRTAQSRARVGRQTGRMSVEASPSSSEASNPKDAASAQSRRCRKRQQGEQPQVPTGGTLIPNRVFVGGIPPGTEEAELRKFFSVHGAVSDVKIIGDKSGSSRCYGFVTFEEARVAEQIVQKESRDGLVFNQRRINIGPAIKKSPNGSRLDSGQLSAAAAISVATSCPSGQLSLQSFLTHPLEQQQLRQTPLIGQVFPADLFLGSLTTAQQQLQLLANPWLTAAATLQQHQLQLPVSAMPQQPLLGSQQQLFDAAGCSEAKRARGLEWPLSNWSQQRRSAGKSAAPPAGQAGELGNVNRHQPQSGIKYDGGRAQGLRTVGEGRRASGAKLQQLNKPHWGATVRAVTAHRLLGTVANQPRRLSRISGPRQDSELCSLAAAHPHLSCESLARAWSVPASRHTVRRRLISAGFRSRADRCNSAPAGGAKFRAWCAARLKWARLRLHWGPEHWARILFTDETCFKLTDFTCRGRQWRMKNLSRKKSSRVAEERRNPEAEASGHGQPASQGALHGLGANKGRATGSVRGAGVSQQTVDITPSSRLTSPVGCLQREQQHLLHRLWAVRLGADEMACELESPTAHAAIECRVGDSLDADVEGGAQQTSVRRIDLLFETKGSPGKPAAASQVLASVWNQTAEVDELLTSREFGRLPVSASAKYCSLDVVRHAEHNGLLRVDHQADTRRNGNQPVQLPLGALDGRGQQGEVVGVAKHAEPLLRQMPRWSSSLVVPGFFGTATMCAVVHSLGAASPKSTRFITLATSAATQGMRSASMGTSSGPSAFPPGDCWASLTTSAALTGATLKLSSAGSGVSGGSVRLSGSGGGGALTMAAKNSRSSFLRSSGVSPARFSGLRRFRPSVDGGPGHAPSGIGPSGRDSLNGVIDSRLLALQVDSCQSCLCLAGWSPAQAELLQIFPRCLNRGVVLPDRLPTLSRLHHRDCLLRGGSDCSAHFRILGTSTLVAQRGVKGASKATLRIGGSERAVVAPRWPLRRTVERIAKVEVADEEPVIGPQSQRRDGAAVDGATTLTETHEHVVELCLSPGCVPATRVPSPPLAAHEGCETAQWLAEAGVGRHHVLPLQEVLQCLGVVVPAWRHEQRPLGPTQDCVQVSEGDRCGVWQGARTRRTGEHSDRVAGRRSEATGGQGDAATALLQPRPDQRSNSSTASLVRRSIVEGPPGAQVLTMKSRVGLDRHLLQRDDVAAQVVRQLRQHPSTPSSLESAAVQRPDPKHALWYGWGSMQLSLTVPGATRRIRVDPRGSSTGGATQPASSVPLTPALNTPTGAPLPSLGPAAFGRRSTPGVQQEQPQWRQFPSVWLWAGIHLTGQSEAVFPDSLTGPAYARLLEAVILVCPKTQI
uniref:RRM domain-containing protein n=1 Tax=Macrostomum lignano TaxID=282301 RepID=A0A1I8GLN2_9PLAT